MYAFCYACDNNYALQVGVSIESLLFNNNIDEAARIYIFADNISVENKKKLRAIGEKYTTKIEFIDTKVMIEKIKHTGLVSNVDNKSLSTFVRLFVQDYIPEEYDILIYLDADTLIDGDIHELINFSSTKPVAAVLDIMPQYYKNIIGFNKFNYYNCGVLRINMKMWRCLQCESKIMNHIVDVYNKYLFADQDVINIVLKGEIDTLPLRFNSFPFYGEIPYEEIIRYIGDSKYYYTKEEFIEARLNPAIVHFVYSVVDRPWFKGNINKYSNEWKKYLSQTLWKKCILMERKFYSRTKIMQNIYKLLGSKSIIWLQIKRNKNIFKKAKKQYEKDGIII